MKTGRSIGLDSGIARHKLLVLRPVKTKDDYGADVVSLELYATVRGSVEAMTGRELEAAHQRWAEAKYKITMQYCAGVDREHTVRWPLATPIDMDVLDASDPDGMRQRLIIIAKDHYAR